MGSQQGRRNGFKSGTATTPLLFPLPFPSPSLSSPPPPLSPSLLLPSLPLPSPKQLGGLGERCKLPERGLGRSPSRQRFLVHFRPEWCHLVFRKFICIDVILEIIRIDFPVLLPLKNADSAFFIVLNCC